MWCRCVHAYLRLLYLSFVVRARVEQRLTIPASSQYLRAIPAWRFDLMSAELRADNEELEQRCEQLSGQFQAQKRQLANARVKLAEFDRLQLENKQLRQELSAFDEDFFEEIEDLKYKYAQAQGELARSRRRG